MATMSVQEMLAALREYRANIDIAIKALEQALTVSSLDQALQTMAEALDAKDEARRADGDHPRPAGE